MVRSLTAVATAVLIGMPLEVRAQRTPLRLSDVLDVSEFQSRESVARSRDGRYLAAAVRRPSRAAAAAEPNTRYFLRSGTPVEVAGAEILVLDLATGKHTVVSGSSGSSWGPSWSPDGSVLAFYSDRDGAARLWSWHRTSRTLRRVTDAIVRPFWPFETPEWSPDGTRLFVKLLPERTTLAAARALLPAPPASSGPPAPADTTPRRGPNVKVFASAPELLDGQTAPQNVAAKPSTGSNAQFLNRSLGDLALVEQRTGRLTRIATQVRAQHYALSADGRYALYTIVRWVDVAGQGDVVYDLVVVDLVGRNQRTLAAGALRDYGVTVSWAPSGHRIAYADSAGALVIVGAPAADAPLGEWRILQRFARAGLSFRADYTPPLWSGDTALIASARDTVWEATLGMDALRSLGTVAGGQILGLVGDFSTKRVFTNGDDGAVVAVVRNRSTLRVGFSRFQRNGSGGSPLWGADVYMMSARFATVPSEDGTVAFVAEDAAHPQEVWLTSADLRTARRVSTLHGELARMPLGESRLVSWRSTTGDTLRGALLLPPAYEAGKRYPLIVHVYAGAKPSLGVNRFGLDAGGGAYNQQLLASRGYAVLYPDQPLTGGKPGEDLMAAVMPAIDRLIALGIADSARVGVTGASNGGYSTLALLTRTNRFAAAIAEQGAADLMRDYTHMRADGSSPGIAYVEDYGLGMGGPPWGALQSAYIAQSPLYQLDRINAPLLLIHGEADQVVPSAFSGEVFVGLRRLGKPVVIALYEGEGHGTGAWRRANLDDYWARVFAWWHRWLGGAP